MTMALMLGWVAASAWAASGGGGTPYFEIPDPFVVNIRGEDPITFLQVNAQLKTSERSLKTKLQEHLPAIRHTMIMVLSEQDVDSLRSLSGKEQLRKQTLEELQALLQEHTGEVAVDNVYFTGFIIQ